MVGASSEAYEIPFFLLGGETLNDVMLGYLPLPILLFQSLRDYGIPPTRHVESVAFGFHCGGGGWERKGKEANHSVFAFEIYRMRRPGHFDKAED